MRIVSDITFFFILTQSSQMYAFTHFQHVGKPRPADVLFLYNINLWGAHLARRVGKRCFRQ